MTYGKNAAIRQHAAILVQAKGMIEVSNRDHVATSDPLT